MSLEEWPRPHYVGAGKNPFLFYVIYGRIDTTKTLSSGTYQSAGVPSGIEVMSFGPTVHPGQVGVFRAGYVWDHLRTSEPDLADSIAAQDSCLVLRGEVVDSPTLDYFRDVIGFLTYCLDAGAVAIYDPQMFKWWGPAEWRSHVFQMGSFSPGTHVVILVSADADGTEWFHTRGMRKFGRPDISIHNVGQQHKKSIVELCNQFIELLAYGGIVPNGQEIRMSGLPSGMKCFLRGHHDDPDFNNEHIEIF